MFQGEDRERVLDGEGSEAKLSECAIVQFVDGGLRTDNKKGRIGECKIEGGGGCMQITSYYWQRRDEEYIGEIRGVSGEEGTSGKFRTSRR